VAADLLAAGARDLLQQATAAEVPV
jgi:hypothetical protein